MIDPAWGPFLFDTSAEGWLARATDPEVARWRGEYLARHLLHVSAATVIERSKGYAALWRRAVDPTQRASVEHARVDYLKTLGEVWPIDAAIALVAGQIMGLIPEPPTPPRRSHQEAESRQGRLARWRFDVIIAATALVARMRLIHNNPADFAAIRDLLEKQPELFAKLGPLELIRCTSLV